MTRRHLQLLAGALTLIALAWLSFLLQQRADSVHIAALPEETPSADTLPLLTVESQTTPGSDQSVHLCLATKEEREAEDDLDLDSFTLRWRDPSGATIADRPLAERIVDTQRGEERCIELEALTLDEHRGPLTLSLEGEGVDQLRGDLLLVDAHPISLLEKIACLLLLLSMLLKLAAWPRGPTPQKATKTKRAWSPIDPVLAVILLFLLTTAASLAFSAKRQIVPTFFSGGAAFRQHALHGLDQPLSVQHALNTAGLETLLILLSNVAITLAIVWGIGRWRSKSPRQAMALHTSTRSLLLPSLIGVTLALVASALLTLLQPEEASPMQAVMTLPTTLVATAAIASLSPWYEELFFRGLIFSSLEDLLSPTAAFILVAGVFTLVHVPQHLGFLVPLFPIAAVAFCASFFRWRRGDVGSAFALHLGYNAVLVISTLFAA